MNNREFDSNIVVLQDLNDLGISNNMYRHDQSLLPNKLFTVRLKWQECGFCYVVLQNEESSGALQDYSINWLFSVEDAFYVVVSLPPPIRADEPTSTYTVLRMLDAAKLSEISDEEFLSAASLCLREVRSCSKTEYSTIEQAMGAFPSWQDVSEAFQSLASSRS